MRGDLVERAGTVVKIVTNQSYELFMSALCSVCESHAALNVVEGQEMPFGLSLSSFMPRIILTSGQ